jgi:DNA-binding beta-propeller fold protein YncE
MKKNIISICLLLVAFATHVSSQSNYQIVKTFHIASMGGWDYPAVDDNSNKLYLSHGGQVNILDKFTGDSIGIINNTSGVHGVAFVPSLGVGYASNGKTNNVTVFDLKTGVTLAQIAVGKNPDWIMYDSFSKKIVTSNHSGGDLSLIDVNTNQVVSTITVGGTKLETVVSDEAGKLFVNLEDKNQVAEVDIAKAAVTNIWDLAPSESPTGLAIDVETKRLFSTCDKILVVMDATNGKIVATIPIGEGCDGAAFDAASKLIFTSNGSGTVSVVKEVSANEFKLVETITTKRGARTISLDSKTHMVYLPTADFEPLPADAPKGTRAKMIPASFQVLVLAPSKK